MFKPLAALLPNTQHAPQPAADVSTVNNVFKVFHGFYGNLFLMKFSTGQLDDAGQDQGVLSARQIWAHGLKSFDGQTVKSAIQQCIDRNPEFPPSLPQLIALCRANQPRSTFKPDTRAIGMGQEIRSVYAAKARVINERHAQRAIDRKTGFIALPLGLDGLKLAIANAVAAAGGDEVAELNRLDRVLTPNRMALA